jgi:protein translocase SecG subunit
MMLSLWVKTQVWLGQISSPSPEAPAAAPSPLAPIVPMDATPIDSGNGFGGMHYLLLFLQLVVCIGLVMCVLSQTTKNEGLGGTISGAAQPVFRGKKSSEEKLSGLTTSLAITFLILSLLVQVFFNTHHA